jgi:hypothetical protein
MLQVLIGSPGLLTFLLFGSEASDRMIRQNDCLLLHFNKEASDDHTRPPAAILGSNREEGARLGCPHIRGAGPRRSTRPFGPVFYARCLSLCRVSDWLSQ